MKNMIEEFITCVTVEGETVYVTAENEDGLKLTQNYDGLVQQYASQVEMICIDNDPENMPEWAVKQRSFIPVTLDARLAGRNIVVRDHEEKNYEPPGVVVENEDALFLAHSRSTVYDGTNIRVDDWGFDESGAFVMETSRTTYFNSLLTNRAVDFKLPEGLTLRGELYDQAYALVDSVLSNHLGFNGWVESADGWFPMVKRGSKVSVGKNTLGNSVNASLKTAYALDDRQEPAEFAENWKIGAGLAGAADNWQVSAGCAGTGKSGILSMAGIERAMILEVRDELKIEPEDLDERPEIIAAYRDLVEGGKPQLLFHIKSRLTKDEIDRNFHDKVIPQDEADMVVDGRQLLWISKKMFENLYITADSIGFQGVKYDMTPSHAASVAILVEYLKCRCRD